MEDISTTSSLSFEYPADVAAAAAKAAAEKKAAAVAAWQARQQTEKEQAAVARLKQDVFYGGDRNWAYRWHAAPKWHALQPDQVSDNGWLTVMRWPENVEIPAITVVDPVTQQERTVNGSKTGALGHHPHHGADVQAAHRVAEVINTRWSAERPNPDTGTTSPDLVRTVVMNDGKAP
jgi:type IV secretory pathway VirB9-like protein